MAYHSYLTIIVPALATYFVTILAVRFILSYFTSAGVVAEDHNKQKIRILPNSGGVAVAFGLIFGILLYTFGGSFVFAPILNIANLLAAALSIMLIAFVGFLDDINVSSRRVMTTDLKQIKKGLKQWQKPLLTVLGAIPLVAINAGVGTVTLPFFGSVSFGLLYPLVLIPLAVIFVSNSINLLGGFDGLQPGMTLSASLGLLLYSAVFGNQIGTLISALIFASILAFFPFSKYSSRILPGDSFNYCVGGAFVVAMVLGNAEAFGFVIFIPWIIEFFLHMRRKFKVTDLGVRRKDGTLAAPYGKKIYSLTHVVMNLKRASEEDVSLSLSLLETLFVVIAFIMKFYGFL